MSARSLAEKFFGHLEAGEVDEILGMVARAPPCPWCL
jgi:hypothetical protein